MLGLYTPRCSMLLHEPCSNDYEKTKDDEPTGAAHSQSSYRNRQPDTSAT